MITSASNKVGDIHSPVSQGGCSYQPLAEYIQANYKLHTHGKEKPFTTVSLLLHLCEAQSKIQKYNALCIQVIIVIWNTQRRYYIQPHAHSRAHTR